MIQIVGGMKLKRQVRQRTLVAEIPLDVLALIILLLQSMLVFGIWPEVGLHGTSRPMHRHGP